MKRKFSILFVIIFSVIVLSENILAIPSFARQYKISCQTCHSPIPRLKAYGDEFAGNGFRLSDQEASRYYVETGDEELSLLREFPLAVRMDAFLTYKNKDQNMSDLKTPFNLKILSSAAISPNVSYYFYFFLSERGEVAGVEDAYLMYNNLFDIDFDIYVGQFQVSDPLFKREVRLTFEDYQVYRTQVGLSRINLTYDRGIMLTYGSEAGTNIMFEIVNGTGLAEANNFRNFDEDKYKNFMGRISQDVNENIRLGAFAYYGKEELTNVTNFLNEIVMWGPDITLSYEDKAELNFQYVARSDDNPYAPWLANSDIKTNGIMSEFIFTPQGDESKWYCVGLYNRVDSENDALDYESLTAHGG
ncbi:MAG: hypothetical protein F9K45_07745, partial [Melioribacteraceae bacterium]